MKIPSYSLVRCKWSLFAFALVELLSGAAHCRAQTTYTLYAFTNFVGKPGGAGNVDGAVGTARFNWPFGVALDSAGNVYVADSLNHTIRKVTTDGVVTTVAGSAGQAGSADGTGSVARFYSPNGASVDSECNVYVADSYNNTIRKITPAGAVTTLAGLPQFDTNGWSVGGSADGTGSAARFNGPSAVCVDSAGNVYVADRGNHTIRKVSPEGAVTTLAGSAGQAGSADGTGSVARFNYPLSVAVDSAGNVYVADTDNDLIRRVTANGVVTTLAGNFINPYGVAVDRATNVYVAEGFTIRKMTPAGVLTTLAGSPEWGSSDGTGSAARFGGKFEGGGGGGSIRPSGLAVDSVGNVYVADTGNNTIRKVTPDGVVTTLAGTASQTGSADGTGTQARFGFANLGPAGIAVDAADNVYVADFANFAIRKVTPAAEVTTLAGGAGSDARFGDGLNPFEFSLAADMAGNVYAWADDTNGIRKVTADGVVTTLTADASGIVAVDRTGNIYVLEGYDVLKVTPDGVVTTVVLNLELNVPLGAAVDSVGNVYFTDTDNHTIGKATSSGVVTTLAGSAGQIGSVDGIGSAARFWYPEGVAVDSAGNVYVADSGNDTIRKVTPAGVVTTVAGSAGVIGGADGIGSAAQFSRPFGIAVDSGGNLYVADFGNDRITKGSPITVTAPRFASVSITSSALIATLSGLVAGTTVVVESSANLQDWLPVQTNLVTAPFLTVSRPINPTSAAEFFRATLK
jgi:sugar lactone lactonase YvrE